MENYVLKIPSVKQLRRFLIWLLGRAVLSLILFVIRVFKFLAVTAVNFCVSLESFIEKSLNFYDQLLSIGSTKGQNLQIISDLSIYAEDKPVVIIGEMGSGKSTLVKYWAYLLSAYHVRIYDLESIDNEWNGFDIYSSIPQITTRMQRDLDSLDTRIKSRNNIESEVVVIDEFPEIIKRVSLSFDWIDSHSRRSRKAKRNLILISQYDKVSAWGLRDKGELIDSFLKIRLGKKANAYSRKLNNPELTSWLESSKNYCLVDDYPCRIPAFEEMRAITGVMNQQSSLAVQNNGKNGHYLEWE